MPRCRTRSILDFRPVDEKVVADSGAEPSLRDLVFKYYISLFLPEETSLELARDYCNQIESAMPTQGESERLQAALKIARDVLGCLDHPQNGVYSGLDMIRGGKKIGDIIDAALTGRT